MTAKQKTYDVGFILGRFSPLHSGHRELIRQAKKRCSTLIIFVGSANLPRSIKNPWTFQERADQLTQFIQHEGLSKSGVDQWTYKPIEPSVVIVPLNDYKYSDAQWRNDVRQYMYRFNGQSISLFGHMKEGNDYLDWFPEFDFNNIETGIPLNATGIREAMLATRDSRMPKEVQEDYDYFCKEAGLFANYPFPETLNFNCADAILECAGQVVLIQRKVAPGAGTWALPGGFKNNTESFLDCAIRELHEETGVKVPEKVLRGSIVSTKLFDDPKRGNGIPRNTLAVHMRIKPNPDGTMPKIKGADDALEARWVTIQEALNEYTMFDDHAGILMEMTGSMPIPAYLNERF